MIGHVALALLLQGAVALGFRSWGAGAATASAWAVAREITQAEYRWIETFGGGLRRNMPWWGGVDPRVWNHLDPWLDWLAPCVVVICVALLANRRRPRRR